MPAPLVSVILHTRNHERFVAEAIESVLGQTFEDWELVVTDNGSTDGTASVIRRYATDARVRVMLFDDNAPIGRRHNQAVRAARGELVSFLYSDDYYLPHKLERQIRALQKLPDEYGVAYGSALMLNDLTGRMTEAPTLRASGEVFESLLRARGRGINNLITPLIRRACLVEEPFHDDLPVEAEAIFFRLALRTRFAHVPGPLTVVRDHGGNAGKAIRRNLEMLESLLARLREHPRMTPRRRKLVDDYEAWALRSFGWQGARLGADPAWARSCFVRAIGIAPLHALHPRTAAGLVITVLPHRLRARVNNAGHALRGASRTPVYLDDYPVDLPPTRS